MRPALRTRAVAALLPLLACALLAGGCARQPVRQPPPVAEAGDTATTPAKPPEGGGLYAPHIRDGAPADAPDIAALPEPVPRAEPRARYGNHSPYVVLGRRYEVLPEARGYVERGIASWYGTKFHGRATSTLEPYDMYAFSAAHKTLPLPTYASVTNLENGRSVIVRINDRGPFAHDRLIDLSYAAAVRLGVHVKGTAPVEVRVLEPLPGAEPPPVRTVQAVPAPAGPGAQRSFVQVGSFGSRDNAERLASRLRRDTQGPVRIDPVELDGRQTFRVRLGPFARIADALDWSERLRAAGFGTPSILSD